MAWYKFEAFHGPGHQSRCIDYFYFFDEEDNDPEHLDLAFENWLYNNYLYNGKGSPALIDKLPETIKEEKKAEYFKAISLAKEMIRILDLS